MKVTLIGISVPNIQQTYQEDCDPDKVVYTALAQCYNDSFNPLSDKYPSVEEMKKVINHVIKSGHHSVAEHVYFSFLIEDVSRALTHQLVRHRIASYSQKSQRYTDGSFFSYVVPPTIAKNDDDRKAYVDHMESTQKLYAKLVDSGVPHEDARFILPNACTSNIVMTMNIRSLGEFFAKRLCKRAQWEIRDLASVMAVKLQDVAPTFFKDNKLGYAACIQNGFCKEGKSCGMMPKLDDLKNAYKILQVQKDEVYNRR